MIGCVDFYTNIIRELVTTNRGGNNNNEKLNIRICTDKLKTTSKIQLKFKIITNG